MRRITLTNGIRIIIEPLLHTRSVSIGLWIKTGSRHERIEQNGICHFIEHMLFKGTEKYTPKEIAQQFDQVGGHINAFTGKEYTCYYGKVLDQHLPMAIDVLADMFLHSKMDEPDLDKERKVIIEEMAVYEDSPDEWVHELVSSAAYDPHSLGRNILGSKDVILNLNAQDLKTFMKNQYGAERLVISLAGNVNESAVELVESAFSTYKIRSQSLTNEIPILQNRTKLIEKATEQEHICLALPGCGSKDERYLAMLILNNWVGGGMSSKLFQEIREDRGLAYSVYSYHNEFLDSGLFTIYLGTSAQTTEETLQLTWSIIQRIMRQGMGKGELHWGKEQLKGNLLLNLESTNSRMQRNGRNELVLNDTPSIDDLITQIDQITLDQIHSLLSEWKESSTTLAGIGKCTELIGRFGKEQLNHD